jgi:phage shock protein PspC (stress-responsive transcriptional regulator)
MYPQTITPHNRLSRPRHGRVFFGVCAGLARRFGKSPRTIRLIFILSCLLPGPQVVVYLFLWLVMPNDPA